MSLFLPVVHAAAASFIGGGQPPMLRKPMLQPPSSFVNFALATSPATLAAPAMAASSDGGVVDTVIGVVFGGACLLLVGFIINYAIQALGVVTENGVDLGKRLEDAGATRGSQSQSDEPVYDNSFAEDLAKMAEPVKKRSKDQLVTDEEIARMAPWMAAKIDQSAIAKSKKARTERKKREAGGR